MKNDTFPLLRSAIETGGGIKPFSASLGVTHQAVYAWCSKGWVPFERAVEIERLTGAPRAQLIKPSLARALGIADQNDVL